MKNLFPFVLIVGLIVAGFVLIAIYRKKQDDGSFITQSLSASTNQAESGGGGGGGIGGMIGGLF